MSVYCNLKYTTDKMRIRGSENSKTTVSKILIGNLGTKTSKKMSAASCHESSRHFIL